MTEDIAIRISDGRQKDIDAIAELEKLCFRSPWSRALIAKEITENPAVRFYLAESEGVIAGCVSCWLIPPYECQLGNVATHPDFRRRHIAARLLAFLIRDVESQGIGDVTLEVRTSNSAAIDLYKKLGFKAEGIRKNYYEGKEDAIIMWRRERPVTAPEENCPAEFKG